MSRVKTKNTLHSYERAAERAGITKNEAKRLFREVSSANITSIHSMPSGPLKKYLIRKSGTGKRIKYYKGYVFVLCSTSTRCLTMYKVHDNVLNAQKEYDEGKNVFYCKKCSDYVVHGLRENVITEDIYCPRCNSLVYELPSAPDIMKGEDEYNG